MATLHACSFLVLWTTLHISDPESVKFPEIKTALEVVVRRKDK